MHLETNLKRIKKIARQRKEENLKFRYFLKHTGLSEKKIGKAVHRLNEEVSRQIDCCSCANCCITMTPVLSDHSIRRLAARLGMTDTQLKKTYLEYDKEEKYYAVRRKPCPFLVDKKCSVYESRPDSCRSFPNIFEQGFTSRLLDVVENCEACPIVFNIYEGLKKELWYPEWMAQMEL